MWECPECGEEIKNLEKYTEQEREDATLDCPFCNTLCVVKEGKVLNFHEYLNSLDDNWPADGKGTFHTEVGGD